MITKLEVSIETDYTHTDKFEATRQRIEKAAFYTQSIFKLIRLANSNFESISDEGDAQDAAHYIEDLSNLCEIGSGLAYSVFREVSNFSLYKFTENGNQADVSEIPESESTDLGLLLSKVLRHPELPPFLFGEIMQAVNTVHSDADRQMIDEMETSPEMLSKIFEAYQANHGDGEEE